jgi:hypothetical protein
LAKVHANEQAALRKKIDLQKSFEDAHGRKAPSHISYNDGNTFPIPQGAVGPFTSFKSGMRYIGGNGGNGLDDRVCMVRFMDAEGRHKKRVVYSNRFDQKVSPVSGKTVSNKHPHAHLDPFKKNF